MIDGELPTAKSGEKDKKMRADSRVLTCLCLGLLGISAAMRAEAGKGKFYIVGMGTAPDLITVRGVEVIKSADVILVGDEQERDIWWANS